MSRALLECGVLVTRPAHQAAGLIRAIEQAGGRALAFPVIEIVPLPAEPPAVAWDWLIFVSPNAVACGWPLLATLAGKARIAAVGPGTARALAARGCHPDAVPVNGADSVALLALPALQAVAGQRILIVRGQDGREILAQTLQERGAKVGNLDVYTRGLPAADPAPVLAAWRDGTLQAALLTSGTAIAHLAQLLGREAKAVFHGTQLVVAAPRMLKLAQQHGATAPLVAAGADDAAMLHTLTAWWSRQHP